MQKMSLQKQKAMQRDSPCHEQWNAPQLCCLYESTLHSVILQPYSLYKNAAPEQFCFAQFAELEFVLFFKKQKEISQ